MANQNSLQKLGRRLFDSLLVVIGLCLLIGLIDVSINQAWLPLLLVLTGIFILSTPAEMAQQGGVITLGLGLYFLLRATDMITLPVLRYVLGAVLISLGTVNLIRNSKGGEVPLSKTLIKQSTD